MKNLFLTIALIASLGLSAASDDSVKEQPKEESVNQSKPVGYVVGIIMRGDNWEQDSLMAFKLQEKHLIFLAKLKEEGKLVASGPLTSSPDARGLYIFKVNTVREAELIVSEDEAIQSGWIKMEFHKWEARDYEIITPTVDEEKPGLFSGALGIMLLIFSIVIGILMVRTFRGKASI
jgi:uncharacterized protein YciI